MIKNVAVCDGNVKVGVELTTPACPLKDQVRRDVESAVRRLPGVTGVEIEFSAQVRSGPMRQAILPGVKNIIAVGAGKGGVGKSTVSVLAAVGLARAGAKVGLMDADVYGPSIPKMLGIEHAKPAVAGQMIIPVVAHNLKVMSIGFMIEPDRAVVWRGPMIHGTIKQFLDQVDWGELDYLIVDLPPGTGDVPLTLAQSIPMTGAVVVCTPQDVALLDAVRAAKMYQQLNVDILGIVENMSYFIAPDTGKEYDLFGKGGAEKAAAKLKVPFLGSIPINIAIRVSGDNGMPEDIFTKDPQGVGRAVTQVVENLAGQISVHNEAQAPALQLNIHR
jgi:ATP-binding protein involved in chromosome partitioning